MAEFDTSENCSLVEKQDDKQAGHCIQFVASSPEALLVHNDFYKGIAIAKNEAKQLSNERAKLFESINRKNQDKASSMRTTYDTMTISDYRSSYEGSHHSVMKTLFGSAKRRFALNEMETLKFVHHNDLFSDYSLNVSEPLIQNACLNNSTGTPMRHSLKEKKMSGVQLRDQVHRTFYKDLQIASFKSKELSDKTSRRLSLGSIHV